MVFPIIPLAAVAAIVGGAGVLKWYFDLSPEEQRKKDEQGNTLAMELFGKALDRLGKPEALKLIQSLKS
ncbi:MAG: hypothetical protein OXC18_20785 [Desulfurellaceae bacterium]|nr:hypothetical protein [Desulfurellaceae bacterium]